MNVLGIADISDDGHTDVRKCFGGETLCFTKFSPGAVPGLIFDGHERRELHGKEGEVALAPVATPVADHVDEKRPILFGATCVGFALIPNCAFDGVGNQRRNHTLIKFTWFPRLPWTWLLELLPCFGRFGFF